MLSRKHYQAMAEILQDLKPVKDSSTETRQMWRNIVNDISDYFAGDNERFNWEKFEEACGMD